MKDRKEGREGVLVYDEEKKSFDVRLSLKEYRGGLFPGECFEVLIDDQWIPTRIEKREDWYLVGVDAEGVSELVGLRVIGLF